MTRRVIARALGLCATGLVLGSIGLSLAPVARQADGAPSRQVSDGEPTAIAGSTAPAASPTPLRCSGVYVSQTILDAPDPLDYARRVGMEVDGDAIEVAIYFKSAGSPTDGQLRDRYGVRVNLRTADVAIAFVPVSVLCAVAGDPGVRGISGVSAPHAQ